MVTHEFELAAPPAGALIESMRGIGYNLETAIADLIDNSISAGASEVCVWFRWDGSNSRVVIQDNGIGMTDAELATAMRPGSRNPSEERSPKDLGRFGLGLKTASFSQCRRVSVVTKRQDRLSARLWDLDYVVRTNEWRLLKEVTPAAHKEAAVLNERPHGTLVIWETLDRLVGDVDPRDTGARDHFQENAERVRSHLGMVFHRFLEGTRPKLKLYVNGMQDQHRVQPWSPFLEHRATLPTPEEPLRTADGTVLIQGFTLPHKDKLTEELYRHAEGPGGWNAQQGFYVYRNERLLVAGSWLDLGWPKEEHYKLARLRIDLPNTMDSGWRIDVKKSSARPPTALRKRIRDLGLRVRNEARQVFIHRGNYSRKHEPQGESIPAWRSVSLAQGIVYRVNREHPSVAALLVQAASVRQDTELLLRVLEESVPVQKIWLDVAEKPDLHSGPLSNANEVDVERLIESMSNALAVTEGIGAAEARVRLRTIEPFASMPARFHHLLTDQK